jgi:tetratricopeptide (TPR) repeat protein
MGILIGKRYVLQEELGMGGMGVVFRALDRLATDEATQVVALKRVVSPTERQEVSTAGRSDSYDMRLSLAQEFKLLATLRHPNIISVLDYGFDSVTVDGQRQPFFTMELLQNAKTITEAGKDQPVDVQVDLLVQLLQALTYLHRRGIIHRDLKPSNVLVTEGNKLKTLDFGLSIGHEQQKSDSMGGTTAGTIGYMAPEVLMGRGASELSDLYAVGVIAYEMFTGGHPFNNEDPGKLINDIFELVPQMTNIPMGLSAVVERLMAKSPDARYESARDVIAAMGRVTGKVIAVETAATRESFLQAARLVGRSAELAHLVSTLDDLINKQEGAFWLIGGESGVGKSRLLDELRTIGLVRGVQVLRGQGVAEQTALYSIWRPSLRALVLASALEDSEAAILKLLIPDIADLLERPIPDAEAALNPQLAQERLFKTVEALFRKQAQSILIVLEDLHWASESLELIHHLVAAKLPILLVASYRDDEYPDLPTKLPEASLLKLNRLSQDGIAELSEAILGENGKQPHVVDLLHRETEGNVFFLVEVVRALAEDAGQLEQIGMMTLPQHIFAGGVHRIVQRRLERVPTWGRDLLQITAVAGRQLDLDLLRGLVTASSSDHALLSEGKSFDEWLALCSDAAVFEVQDNQWRFSHDKLREGVLRELDETQKRTLHEKVAQTMEQVYASAPDRAATLAYHWQIAGNTAKEAHYSAIAGEQAMQQGANRQATDFFEAAVRAFEKLPEEPDMQMRFIDVAVKLSRVGAFHQRGTGAALKAQLERALQWARDLKDEVREAYTLGSIGAHLYVRGELGEAIGYFTQVMALAEKLGLEELLVVPYNIMARVLILIGDLPKALPLLTRGIPLAEKYQDLELYSGSLAFRALLALFEGDFVGTKAYFDQAMSAAEKLGHPSRISGNWTVLGCAYSIAGYPDDSDECLHKSQVLAEKTQDKQIQYINAGSLGHNEFLRGNDDKARELLDQALQMAEQNRWILYVGLFQSYRAEVDLALGDVESAAKRTQIALQIAEKANQKTALGETLRVMGMIDTHQKKWEAAEKSFTAAIEAHQRNNTVQLVATCQFELSKVYRSMGQTEKAATMLASATATFERLNMKLLLRQAQAAQTQS